MQLQNTFINGNILQKQDSVKDQKGIQVYENSRIFDIEIKTYSIMSCQRGTPMCHTILSNAEHQIDFSKVDSQLLAQCIDNSDQKFISLDKMRSFLNPKDSSSQDEQLTSSITDGFTGIKVQKDIISKPISYEVNSNKVGLSRQQVIDIIKSARELGQTPDLRGADLRGVNLSGVNLSGANLSGVRLFSQQVMDILESAQGQRPNLHHADIPIVTRLRYLTGIGV